MLIKTEKEKLKQYLIKEMKKYQCDFNWDFEKNKAKHKSYIALDKILEILEKA